MNNMIRKICIVLTLFLGLAFFMPVQVAASEIGNLQPIGISSFEALASQEITIFEKESFEKVSARLPENLEAVSEEGERIYIPVKWECVGDYAETNYYYYQFVPVIDSSFYTISEEVELPYIWLNIDFPENLFRGVTSSANETTIYNYLINELKCNFATALGILANIERESSFNPKAQYPAKGEPSYYGICQWGGSRLNDLKTYCSKNNLAYNSLEGQLNFLKYELYGTEKRAWSKMQGIENTQEGAYLAGYNWAKYFERCASVYYEVSAKRARDVYWPKYATDAPVDRISGKDRYMTGFLIADCLKNTLGVAKFDHVIIATGNGFADALSGSYLAYVKKAPILLTNGTNLSDIKQYIEKNMNASGTVYILGGESAVSKEAEAKLKPYQVKRLYGKNRYETNLKILKESGGSIKELVVCTGENFADSLSASASGKPIFLVSNVLSDSQTEYLNSMNITKIYVVGGEGAINKKIETLLGNYGTTIRIAGKSRYETSVAVAEAFSLNTKIAVLTYSENFPDGICGGPLAAVLKAPLLLTKTANITSADNFVQKRQIADGYVLGGTKLISDDAVRKIFNLKISDQITKY